MSTLIQPTPTQVNHPWRAVVRTVFQFTLALAVAAPVIYAAITLQSPELASGAVASILTAAGAVVRVMNTPAVNQIINQYLPFLSANGPLELETSLGVDYYDPADVIVDSEAYDAELIATADDYPGDIDPADLAHQIELSDAAQPELAQRRGVTPTPRDPVVTEDTLS